MPGSKVDDRAVSAVAGTIAPAISPASESQTRAPMPRMADAHPPSSAGDAATSLRSTFFTISVSLACVGAGTPMKVPRSAT